MSIEGFRDKSLFKSNFWNERFRFITQRPWTWQMFDAYFLHGSITRVKTCAKPFILVRNVTDFLDKLKFCIFSVINFDQSKSKLQ